jgi:hypothetical protein
MGGEDTRKGYRRVNMVKISCTHVWKLKNKTCWTITEIKGGGIKNDGGGDSIMIPYKNFVKCPMHLQYHNIKNFLK